MSIPRFDKITCNNNDKKNYINMYISVKKYLIFVIISAHNCTYVCSKFVLYYYEEEH